MNLSTTDSRFVYDGDGTTTEFSFPRKIIEAAHLDVWLYDEDDDSYALQTLNTHYTFAGSGLTNGIYASATITFTTAPGTDKKVVLYRDPSLIQEADFTGETNVLNALNRFADRVTMWLQRVQDQLDRTIKLPDGDYATSWGNTNAKADYASALLGFNSSGVPIPSNGTSTVAVSTAMTPVVQGSIDQAMEALDQGDFTSTGTTTARNLADRFADELWAEDFGASPSASASTNATALQAWIDACASSGKIGRIGPGVFGVDATLIMKDGARLRGSGHFNWARTAYAYTDSNPTVIKNDGTLTGTNSVVFRCSQMAVGVRGNDFVAPNTSDLQNIEVSDIHFDANGAQYAAYYYRCANESGVYRVSHSGATVAGAFLAGLFTARNWHLSAMQNSGRGFLIGLDTADTNLTDEAACNGLHAYLCASQNGMAGIEGKISRGSEVTFNTENNDGGAAILRQYGADAGVAHWHEVYSENSGNTTLYFDGTNAIGLRLTRDYAHRGPNTIVSRAHFYGDGTTNAKSVTNGAGITAANLYVYADGVRMTPTTDYTVADNGANLDVTPTSNWSASVRYAIHGNTTQGVVPDVLTLIACDASGTPVTDGGLAEEAYWPLIDGRFVNVAGSFINSNTGRYRLEADGRSNAQTTLQFINRAPLRTRPYVLAESAVASSVTGTTSETTLATVTVPARSMGANGRLRISGVFSMTDSTNSKTVRVKFGGTTYLTSATTTSGVITHRFEVIIANVNSETSQKSVSPSNGFFGFTSSALVTSTHNTALDQNVTFTGILANTGETITLESYCVEVLPGR